LFFLYFLKVYIFRFAVENVQRTKTKLGGKDNSYLEEIEAKFQQDPLRGFGWRGICDVDNGCDTMGRTVIGTYAFARRRHQSDLLHLAAAHWSWLRISSCCYWSEL